MAPNEVNFENADTVRDLRNHAKPKSKLEFNNGDKVRISKAMQVFQWGYLPPWSEEISANRRGLS